MAITLDLWADLAGVVLPHAGDAAPAGWLMCYGQEVSREEYANLFAAIGIKHGDGDGETTFNLPDGRGRVIAGLDNMGGTPAARITLAASGFDGTVLGAAGGAPTVALTAAQMPVHKHTLTDPGHGHGVSDPGHGHGVNDPGHGHGHNMAALTPSSTGGGAFQINGYAGGTLSAAVTGISIQGAGSNISIQGAGTGITMQDAGSGAPHSVMQPTLVLNHIIKI